MTPIKPCPFCGHPDPRPDKLAAGRWLAWVVCCEECDCIGPLSHESLEAAVAYWNKAEQKQHD